MSERDHERHIRRAIALAGRVPDLPFGAVIVHQDRGEVVAEGWNRSGQNPTWHGEIDALNALFASGFPGDRGHLAPYTEFGRTSAHQSRRNERRIPSRHTSSSQTGSGSSIL